jgi:AcrR family transcriptional regulator
MAVVKRMDSARRRQHLLAAALDVIRRDGTDALTLARVAEAGGVTKPIAYRQFKDRGGLLKALYVDYDERQHAAMQSAVEAGGDSLAAVARIVAEAYLDCVMTAGPEMAAITAALSASEDMETFRDSLRDGYLRQFHAAFSRFAKPASRAEYVAIFGACEALAQAATSGGVTRGAAIDALATIIVGTLQPK